MASRAQHFSARWEGAVPPLSGIGNVHPLNHPDTDTCPSTRPDGSLLGEVSGLEVTFLPLATRDSVYTDASEVPERIPERPLLAVLFDPLEQALLCSSCPVFQTTVDTWLPKKTGQLELLAAPFTFATFATWKLRLRKRPVILHVD